MLTRYSYKDSKNFVTYKVVHHYYMTNVGSDIPGIYKTIFYKTSCPRCNEQLTFVQPHWKIQCSKCNLWMTNLFIWYGLLGKVSSELLIWDETVLKK